MTAEDGKVRIIAHSLCRVCYALTIKPNMPQYSLHDSIVKSFEGLFEKSKIHVANNHTEYHTTNLVMVFTRSPSLSWDVDLYSCTGDCHAVSHHTHVS